jgi:hypothetical protein
MERAFVESVSPVRFDTAVPVSDAVRGLLELVELTVSEPVRVPPPGGVGLKATSIVQLAEGASVAGLARQVMGVTEKSPVAPIWMLPMAVLPVFESVNRLLAEVFPSVVLGKVHEVGVSVAVVVAATPVPVRDSVNTGFTVSLDVTVRVLLCRPVTEGVKVTLIVQVL